MRFELEVVAEELLPAVRSVIASRLSREYGLTQQEIAAQLGVTQPAVSQYLNKSRADPDVVDKLGGDPQVDILLDDAASKAAKGEDFSPVISQVVETARDKGLLSERFEGTEKL